MIKLTAYVLYASNANLTPRCPIMKHYGDGTEEKL